jgi:hypothetical protein
MPNVQVGAPRKPSSRASQPSATPAPRTPATSASTLPSIVPRNSFFCSVVRGAPAAPPGPLVSSDVRREGVGVGVSALDIRDDADARSGVLGLAEGRSGVLGPRGVAGPTPRRATCAFFGLSGTKSTSFCSSSSARGLANGRRGVAGPDGERGGVLGEASVEREPEPEDESEVVEDASECAEDVERVELDDVESSDDVDAPRFERTRSACVPTKGEGESGVGGNVFGPAALAACGVSSSR